VSRPQEFRIYKVWFYAAAIYNVLWGIPTILWPRQVFALTGYPLDRYPALFQCIGMMVAVYGLGYYYLAVNPKRFAPYIWVGLLGKTCGPIGLVWVASHGELPWRFGYFVIINDLIWWPVFWSFALKHARGPLREPSNREP
jgi:hypothetical protein